MRIYNGVPRIRGLLDREVKERMYDALLLIY